MIRDSGFTPQTFRRFERWQAVRAGVQFLNFAVAIWALAVNGIGPS